LAALTPVWSPPTSASSSNYANAVALQGGREIVVVGNAFVNSFASDIAVLRYNTDGSLDTGFGGGTDPYDQHGAFDNGFAVAVQGDNKIVVAGNADAGYGRPTLLCCDTRGWRPGFRFWHRLASSPAPLRARDDCRPFAVVCRRTGGEIVVAGLRLRAGSQVPSALICQLPGELGSSLARKGSGIGTPSFERSSNFARLCSPAARCAPRPAWASTNLGICARACRRGA